MSWPMAKLGDVSEPIMGQAPPGTQCNKSGQGTIFIKAGEFGVKFPEVKEWTTKPLKFAKAGDTLLCVVGATCGKVNRAIDCSIGRSVAAIRPNTEVLDSSYLYYFISSWSEKLRLMSQGAAQTVINKDMINSLEIPLPPLEEQKRIAAILDKADAIRQKRKQAIALADDFLRSVFLDMFGDPVTNPKGFPLGTIRDLVESANYGTSGKASESEGEYPVLRMGNITYQGSWDFSDLKYIDLTEKERPKYLAHKGDLLFNRTNSRELVGKTAVYEEELPMAFAGYLVRVRANEMGNTYYLSGYLNSGHGKKVLSGMCKSIVGMANINAQELQNIKLLLPPIELQNRYEEIVKAVRSRVSTQIVSLTELNELFSSLSQKAFSGQL
ncbi:restriction endonuclease subunit S [Vibrio vulnificus]|nr:restriction endonuclease subunit S [Vibrio vulnificus]MCU8453555.1 restriction endonuclease subunit S [Vibrio vulnificus]HAS8301065.1 restriction endonuclease [Vibrio vulnificus]